MKITAYKYQLNGKTMIDVYNDTETITEDYSDAEKFEYEFPDVFIEGQIKRQSDKLLKQMKEKFDQEFEKEQKRLREEVIEQKMDEFRNAVLHKS